MVIEEIPLHSVVDVGGGAGSWSLAASELGAGSVTLIDGPHVDPTILAVPQEDFVVRDLARRFSLPETADLTICMEVAEHLPPNRAPSFVEDLCALSDNVLFSAAIPYQGGDGHVNEMWPEYWADLFDACGYDAFDFIRPRIWSDTRVDWWYRQNVLLFSRRASEANGTRRIGGEMARSPDSRLTRIHPEAYISLAHRRRPDRMRASAARDVAIYSDHKRHGRLAALGYGGEFDSVPRPELMSVEATALRAVIVGPGRTGSTALADALSDHAGVFCFNETQDLPLLEARFGNTDAPTRALCDTYLSAKFTPGRLIADHNARRAQSSPNHLRAYLDRLCSANPEMTVAAFARHVASYFKAVTGCSVLIDKTPDYAHHLDTLLAVWPDLRIVLMVRKAAPTAVSMRGHHGYRTLAARGAVSWAGLLAEGNDLPKSPPVDAPDDFGAYLDIWSARIEDSLRGGDRLDTTQFTVARYEDLCAAPRDEGRRLLRFFGCDPSTTWLDSFAESFTARPVGPAAPLREAELAAQTHDRVITLNARLGYT